MSLPPLTEYLRLFGARYFLGQVLVEVVKPPNMDFQWLLFLLSASYETL